MSDLVPELRRVAEWLRGWDPDEGKLHTLAADRIESLEAEVRRLQEGLRSVRYIYELYRDSPPMGMDVLADDVVDIARAALAGEGDEGE